MNSILDVTAACWKRSSPELGVTDPVSGIMVCCTQVDLFGRSHLITAILKFDISNTFAQWEQAFMFTNLSLEPRVYMSYTTATNG